MNIMEMMNYNFNSIDQKIDVHGEIAKKMIEKGKITENALLWLSCSDSKVAKYVVSNQEKFMVDNNETSKRMVA